jgi:hypothetical protein
MDLGKNRAWMCRLNTYTRGGFRGDVCEHDSETFFISKRYDFDGQLPSPNILKKILHRGVG